MEKMNGKKIKMWDILKIVIIILTISVLTINVTQASRQETHKPKIIFYEPQGSIIYDTEPAHRVFGITVNQDANMSFNWNELYYLPVWWPAREEFFLDDQGQSAGTYNITFTASNSNGTVSKSWVWIVSPASP